ncbi:serine/threonine-protein kinase [Legionella maioricensis]|uniref:Serine/threonine-protein kinase n=1 Tax=Legionella maioricensis TaxID=2896528 RepID=A0A9X2CXM5_9GAMM|nr:serine/threonine-protein kinase [Legionella maioricensis]MCL9682705.1 serine/threonine-protein kinase [Legionella maioricensis]MCL9687247.1 serine/threonine-protein kinase [Legionella maioricensis]
MALKSPPSIFGIPEDFLNLITTFNTIPEEDHIQRLFYLQKINYRLKDITLNSSSYAWLSDTGPEGWQAHLHAYSINADASIFVKGMQFAEAIARHTKDKPLPIQVEDVYPLLQERDELLRNPSFEACKERYIAVNCQLHVLVDSERRIKEILDRHSEILAMAKAKLDAIQKRETLPAAGPTPTYKTKELGGHVNNDLYTLEIEGIDDLFVFRVEDRDKLGVEQDLHSFPVAKYFIEDYAVFMMRFKGSDFPIEYRPVVLSQYATGGNLAEVARSLRGTRDKDLGAKACFYFAQLGDFCEKLIEAKTYHPDIKLTNFLVHSNLIRVSDRKTFTAEAHPMASEIRSTPPYAPDEFTACLNERWTNYDSDVASETVMNMPQFMAYQLGMALKEFLILTQVDDVEIAELRKHDFNPALYFKTTPNPIVNFSLLIQELTRPDPNKRLSIQQFKNLLKFRNMKPEHFYKKIEEELPSATLGFQEDIDAINTLLNGSFPETEFITQANILFNKISKSQEPRLIRMAEKLATKCYREYAEPFFKQSIETALLNNDWEEAPWYRKLIHVLSFGYFSVDRVTQLSDIQDTMGLDLNGEQFLSYFPHLEFLTPSAMDSLGKIEAEYLKNVIRENVEMIISHDSMAQQESSESTEDVAISTTIPLDVAAESKKKTLPLNATPVSSMEKDPLSKAPEISKQIAPLNVTPVSSMKKDSSLTKSDAKHDESLDKESSESSSDWGTIVINDKKRTSVAARPAFFSSSKVNDETAVKPKAPVASRVDSVRTALFRGDGSHRKKPIHGHRTTVGEINWDPLPIAPVDEPPRLDSTNFAL